MLELRGGAEMATLSIGYKGEVIVYENVSSWKLTGNENTIYVYHKDKDGTEEVTGIHKRWDYVKNNE